MYSNPNTQTFRLTFKGFLAVRLMEFEYAGKHYSYHGKKLENAVKRLPFGGDFPKAPSTAELVVWGQAVYDWKIYGGTDRMTDLRNALAKARDEWLESDEGKSCGAGEATGVYLRNRLEQAFIAGWVACGKREVPGAKEAYEAGKLCAKEGPNEENCHFRFFRTPEHTAEWERGRAEK